MMHKHFLPYSEKSLQQQQKKNQFSFKNNGNCLQLNMKRELMQVLLTNYDDDGV